MSTSSWSVLLGSAMAVLVATSDLPPQPPADSSQGASSPEATQTIAWWRGGAPAGGRFGGRREGADDVFVIAPSPTKAINVVWHNCPLLIWEGAVSGVELSDAESGELIWSQTVAPDQGQLFYTGAALQPGQIYEWVLRDYLGTSLKLSLFEVMAEGREQIAVELADLETALKAAGASAEAIALQRAAYFKERGLMADVLQEAFSVEAPSAELAELLQVFPAKQLIV